MHDPTKFRVERTVSQGVTLLSMHGTVDASFNGDELARSVKTEKLVVDLKEVRRFASWGMAEWMNLLRGVTETDLYFVECSSYAMQQINLVNGLLGHGKVVSCQVPYGCGSCGEETDTLVVLADENKVRQLLAMETACPACGRVARLTKFAADTLNAITSRSAFDIDEDVAAFLRSHLRYEIPTNLTRFRAREKTHGRYTYLRLLGNVATMPADAVARASRGTTVVDLAGAIVEDKRLDAWRTYVTAAVSNVDTLQLLDCPIGFIDRGVTAADLEGKVKIRTFAEEYTCAGCTFTSTAMIDVADNLEQLAAGMLPGVRCPQCKSDMVGTRTTPLPKFPARVRDIELDQFIMKARSDPDDRLDNALKLRPAKVAKSTSVTRSVFIGSALATVLVGGGLFLVFFVFDKGGSGPAQQGNVPVIPQNPGFQRPDWIVSNTPSSAFCEESGGRLTCVGVSPFASTKDAGAVDAADAALEEMVNAVGLKVQDPWFRENVLAGYAAARNKALASAQNSGGRGAEDEKLRATRKRVVANLQASGGPTVPSQRTDWYWEEYDKQGGGTEFLVFVKYDLTQETVTSLVQRYATPIEARGLTLLTAFPSLAWLYPTFDGGVIVSKASDAAKATGVAPASLVVSLNDQKFVDANALAKQLGESPKATVGVASKGVVKPVELP